MFANTADGCEALLADGVLCESAVLEPAEPPEIPFASGRWIWRREAEVPRARTSPQKPLAAAHDLPWLAGEALSNLLVGLQRWQRGERLAAMRLVQLFALDRMLELTDRLEPAASASQASRDPFNADRRYEYRHPGHGQPLRHWAGGIDATPQPALALLLRLQQLAEEPPTGASRVRELAG